MDRIKLRIDRRTGTCSPALSHAPSRWFFCGKTGSLPTFSHTCFPFFAALAVSLLLSAISGFAESSTTASLALTQAKSLADSGNYREAIATLKRGGHLDPASKEFLAQCLYLNGDPFAALDVLNSLHEPVLDDVSFSARGRSNHGFVEGALGAMPGQVLESRRLRTGVRVLRDAGVPVTATPVDDLNGHYGLDVSIPEQHGPFSSWFRFGAWSTVSAIAQRTRLSFDDIDGRGTSLSFRGRWAHHRHMIEGRGSFLTTVPFLMRDTAFLRWEQRVLAPALDPSHLSNTEVHRTQYGVETAVAVSPSSDILVGVGHLGRSGKIGTDTISPQSFVQPMVGVRYSREEADGFMLLGETRITYSSNVNNTAPAFTRGNINGALQIPLASSTRLLLGASAQAVSNSAPPEELVMAGVGTGSDYVLPFRGHPLYTNGVAGYGPVGYRGAVFQTTFLQKIYTRGTISLWGEGFADEGRLWKRLDPGTHRGWLTDVGAGLRVMAPGGLNGGIRRGYGLTDHTKVWDAYLGKQF